MTECPICYNHVNEPFRLECEHTFCTGCIINWMASKRPITCPYCRSFVNKDCYEKVMETGIDLDLIVKTPVVHYLFLDLSQDERESFNMFLFGTTLAPMKTVSITQEGYDNFVKNLPPAIEQVMFWVRKITKIEYYLKTPTSTGEKHHKFVLYNGTV
uniref:RING-type domain-containing protein n=1 Tax=viral metagenome TaxID=1070528 RepID=A0A6C0IA58_9ZZZZ